MPESSETGDVRAKGRGYEISFRHIVGGRLLSFRMDNFLGSLPIKGEIVLTREPGESIVMCNALPQKGALLLQPEDKLHEGLGHGVRPRAELHL